MSAHILPTQRSSSLTVLILAGGQSTRMGRDKACLDWHGTPLLTRCCQVAQLLAKQVYVLSPWPERYTELIPQNVSNLRESDLGRGPLWALQDGISHCDSDWILVLACDMPLLDPTQLTQWRSQLAMLPTSCLAYVPQTSNTLGTRWEPMCGFYRRSSLANLEQFLAQGGKSFQEWLSKIEAIAIPMQPEDMTMLANANTPEDWSQILATPSPFKGEKG